MNKVIESLCNRSTVRSYDKEKGVKEEDLKLMLESAGRAPTTGNMQLYSAVITRDKESLKLLAEKHFNQPASTSAPMMITFCADLNRYKKWCKKNDADSRVNNEIMYMSAVIDCALAAQNFVTAAESLGYGTCYLGTTIYNAEKIAEQLLLPKFVIPILTLSVGVPMSKPQICDRINVSGWVHNDKYNDYDENDIDNIFGYKESMEENIKFIKENNKKTLAQVFADVRYPHSDCSSFGNALKSFVEKQMKE